MTIPGSTIPTVKNYLVTQIAALVADAAVLVSYDQPVAKPDDIIMVGEVHRDITIVGVVGSGAQGWLEEDYTIDVVVSCYRGGDDAKTLFERLATLVDDVVQVVRTDPSCAGAVLQAYPDSVVYEPSWETKNKGRVAEATVKVRCTAHI